MYLIQPYVIVCNDWGRLEVVMGIGNIFKIDDRYINIDR
jgi:hypothetical protein